MGECKVISDRQKDKRIADIRKGIKNARRNAVRQRDRQILARHTRRDVRVRPEFWEQVERELWRELKSLA